MAQLNYEIPDGLHRDLKMEAARSGVTLKSLIISFLNYGLVAVEEDNDE